MSEGISSGLSLVFMVTIVNRGKGEKLSEMFAEEGIRINMITFGKGTASSEMLGYLGIDETEKDILISTMSRNLSKKLLSRLDDEEGLYKKNHGIAFTVPVGSVMSGNEVENISGGGNEGNIMDTNKDLIIAVANRGYTIEVMDAAKSAGATGGTVLHARGTGLKETEKFFGVTIQPEKELVLILAGSKNKEGIMKAIIEKAGPSTDAKAIVFSLPVNGVAGLSTFTDEY